MSQVRTREVVQPATGQQETVYVIQFALAVLGIAGGLLAARSQPAAEQEIQSHQISAYHDLDTTEQGIYNDLLAASLDIDAIHAETLAWPNIEELESIYLSPFVQDSAWRKRGKLQWSQLEPESGSQHSAAYVGLSTDPDASGSFLLWMTHSHGPTGSAAEADFKPQIMIWYHSDGAAEKPASVQAQYFIAHGWREVVTYTGDDERRRFTGAGEKE